MVLHGHFTPTCQFLVREGLVRHNLNARATRARIFLTPCFMEMAQSHLLGVQLQLCDCFPYVRYFPGKPWWSEHDQDHITSNGSLHPSLDPLPVWVRPLRRGSDEPIGRCGDPQHRILIMHHFQGIFFPCRCHELAVSDSVALIPPLPKLDAAFAQILND